MKLLLRYLSFRLFLLLLGVMIVVFGIHTWLDIRTTSTLLTDYVNLSAARASDLIVRSTRYSMLLNRKEDVHQTIRTLGNEPGFVEINIYNKSGAIIFSTDSLKINTAVDLEAEACIICHASDAPLESVPEVGRVRDYQSPEGGHVLGLISAIRNEKECSSAACHAHPAEQTVLGILDVKMSLASVDARVAGIRGDMLVSAVVMILIISGISGLFIYRVVRRPIRRLSLGMNKVAAGDLDARIDLYSDDEIGRLASTFNTMAGDLKTARDELHEWARTLEERISNKTSELREAQSQIIHMEKMASLGKLSASVAHEINNPLFGILTYSKLVVRELDPDDADDDATRTARDYLKIIQEESSRCGEIVKGLLDFARQTGGEFELHHLNDIVDKSLILLRHHFEMKQIAVRREFLASNDTLVCDARQLQQAIIAPCINALEAMSKGGALTVRTKGDEDEIAIEIEDSGVGIPKDTHSRIFEPFFTTKQGESGLGLGLSVTYGIVQRHRGRIDVESEPDKGTTITITLPREPAVETETVRG